MINATIFNSAGLLGQPVIRTPSKNVGIIMEGAGRPEEHQFPSGLDIMEVTPGVVKQTTSGLPDSIGIARQNDYVLNTTHHPGLKENYSDLYFESTPPIPNPTDYHLKTNTELMMEMNTYEDGVRKHSVPEKHMSTRERHLKVYEEMLVRGEHLRLDQREEVRAEANRYLMINDPELYQALLHDRRYHPVEEQQVSHPDQMQIRPEEHKELALIESKEIQDEIDNLPNIMQNSVQDLISMFNQADEEDELDDVLRASSAIAKELTALREKGLISRVDAATSLNIIDVIQNAVLTIERKQMDPVEQEMVREIVEAKEVEEKEFEEKEVEDLPNIFLGALDDEEQEDVDKLLDVLKEEKFDIGDTLRQFDVKVILKAFELQGKNSRFKKDIRDALSRDIQEDLPDILNLNSEQIIMLKDALDTIIPKTIPTRGGLENRESIHRVLQTQAMLEYMALFRKTPSMDKMGRILQITSKRDYKNFFGTL